MKKSFALYCRKFALPATIVLLSVQLGWSQSVPMQYQYQFYQKFNAEVYSVDNSAHTAVKPFLMDEKLTARNDSLMAGAPYKSGDSWLYRKIFNEHLFDVRNDEYTFYADPIVDLQIGRDMSGSKTTWLNARGFQLGGTIGTKFSFYSSGFENQGRFPEYYQTYINQIGIVPGQAYSRSNKNSATKDWSYVTALISYTPIKQLNFTLGQDKVFVGDGYRSLLLSDYASNYPFFKTTLTLGPVQYTTMWAYMQDRDVQQFDVFGNNRRKWAAFHYFDWNITNRVSVGFFNAYIAPEADNTGKRRGFDANFINPLFFTSSIGPSSQPGNSLAGFTGKYKFADKHALYAQLLLDKGQDLAGNAVNTKSWQAGVRGADLFGVRSLNYLVEYNKSEPYTYTGAERLSNFTQFAEPLAHPFGNDFNEVLGIMNYSVGRFDFQGQLMYAKYHLNATVNSDGEVTRTMRPFINSGYFNPNIPGLNTSMQYAHGTVSFLINPRTNLRVEIGGLYRREKSDIHSNTASVITFGIRSSFRNMYRDF